MKKVGTIKIIQIRKKHFKKTKMRKRWYLMM